MDQWTRTTRPSPDGGEEVVYLRCRVHALRAFRDKAGLSVRDLAQRLEVDPSTLFALEVISGKHARNPSWSLAQRIAGVFEVPLEAFCDVRTSRPANGETH